MTVRRRSGVFTRLLERLVLSVAGPLFTRSLQGTSMAPVSPLGWLSISLSSWTHHGVDISKLMDHGRRPWPSANLPSPPAASSKPSLDGILCTSLVALTNKHRLYYDAFPQELCIPGCVMENTVSQKGVPANGYN